jgi:C-terminal processing protease CtpA/Prc
MQAWYTALKMRRQAPLAGNHLISLTLIAGLAACGGGGGGGSGFAGEPGGGTGWTEGAFLDASTFAAKCAAPRNGSFPDIQGTSTDENNFLRSYSNDTYLWYDEIVDEDPAPFSTPDYFDRLKTTAMTASGQPKDRFHFTFPTDEWEELSQSGVSAGYGAQWVIIAGAPPREVLVAYTEPNSPATDPAANLARGAEVLVTDGVDVVNSNSQAEVDVINAAFFPAEVGETHMFTIRDLDGTTRDIAMTSAKITSTPVQNVGTIAAAPDVGYILFNSHIATAEAGLIDAVNQLAAAGITDLVVDLRYNGGGFLDIASEFAYMIAGAVPTAGRDFENLRFNDKHPETNPVTGQPLSPTPFHTTTQGFDPSVPVGQALPALNLSRVFVLTGPNTCSASESIVNSLRGVDVEIIQVGSTTCGKPYGFYATDNCGTTYFTIQFKGENDKGFGDYTDGFSPDNSTGIVGTVVPGCSIADDFTHALGDPAEARLAAALSYRAGQTCPAPSGIAAPEALKTSAGSDLSAVDGYVPKPVWHQNRIVRR